MENLKFDAKKVNYYIVGTILLCAILSLVFCFLPFSKTLVGNTVSGIGLLKYNNSVIIGSMVTLLICLCLDIVFILFLVATKIFPNFKVNDLLVKILLIVDSLLGIVSIIMLTLVAREIANLQVWIYLVLALIIVSSITKIYNIYKTI